MTIPYPDNPLAQRLKAARGTMLSKNLADGAGWPASKVSKIESGRQLPTVEDLATWARLTQVGDTAVQLWISMLEQIQADERSFRQDMRAGQRTLQREYDEMIKACTAFFFYEKQFVPRFLQVPGYTRGLLEYGHRLHRPDVAVESEEAQRDIDAAVAIRQVSTSYLFEPHRHFELILDEAVLRTWRFSPEIMRTQLLRLQSAIGLPNVRLGIFPQNRFVTATGVNSFEIYGDLVSVETSLGVDPKIRADEVKIYHEQMERLWADSVEDDEALQLIEEARRAIPN